MRYKILKNKKNGKYFGHLNDSCSGFVDYDNIEFAYLFNIDVSFLDYDTIFYDKELRKQKFKQLNEI